MKNDKFKVLCCLFAGWLGLFLVTLRTKSPRMEQVDALILFICFCWFAYWSISAARLFYSKKDTPAESEEPKPTEQATNAKSKKSPKSV